MPSGMLSKALNTPVGLRPLHKLILIFMADKSQCDEVYTSPMSVLAEACQVPVWEVEAAFRTLIHSGYLIEKQCGNGNDGFTFTEGW